MPVSSVQAQNEGQQRLLGDSHLVQAGETLGSIAATHGLSAQALMGANAQLLHPDLIQPGQVLSLPSQGEAAGGLLGGLTGLTGALTSTLAGVGGLTGALGQDVSSLASTLDGNVGNLAGALEQDISGVGSTLAGDLTGLMGELTAMTGALSATALNGATTLVNGAANIVSNAAQGAGEYTVQAGDTLSLIGQRLGVSWPTPAQLNPLNDPNLILPGQRLVLAVADGRATGGAPVPNPSPSAGSSGGGGGIAQSYLGQDATSLMASHALPMDLNSADTGRDAAFVSAAPVKAGALSASGPADLVSTLDSTPRAGGRRPISAADAKPGDVVIMQGGGIDHTETVPGPGQMIGPNNDNADGAQRVSYDSLSYAASYDGAILQPPAGVGAPVAHQTQGADPTAPASTGDKVQQAVSYFESQGWTRAQAAGIVANLQTESNLSSSAVGDGGAAYGLAQWRPDRQASFDQVYGHSIQGSSFQQQLAFVQYELTHTEGDAGQRLQSAGSAGEAGSIVSRYYERPADADGQASARAVTANTIYGETR